MWLSRNQICRVIAIIRSALACSDKARADGRYLIGFWSLAIRKGTKGSGQRTSVERKVGYSLR
jgi:hypothetical protein